MQLFSITPTFLQKLHSVNFSFLPAAEIMIEGVRDKIREGEASARFNIRLLSGKLAVPVDLIYSTYNINATGILVLFCT